MNRKISIVSAVLFGALTLSAVGCASPAASDTGILDDSESDDRADGTGARLRRRATWSIRLAACRSAYDESVATWETETHGESESRASIVDAYTECVAAANDRAIPRMARNIAESVSEVLVGEEQNIYTQENIADAFKNYRSYSDYFCSLVTGAANLDTDSDYALFVAPTQLAECKLLQELALTKEIGDTIAWDDVSYEEGDTSFDVSSYIDGVTSPVTPTPAPVCQAALDAATANAQDDLTWASFAFAECVGHGIEAAIPAAAANVVPHLSGAAAEDYADDLRAAFVAFNSFASTRCDILVAAGIYAGDSIASALVQSCKTAEVQRIGGYVEGYGGVMVAADAAADPDSNGIPGTQPAESEDGEEGE